MLPQSFAAIGVLTSVAIASAAYIVVIASYSPAPPLDGQAAAVVMVSPSSPLVLMVSTSAGCEVDLISCQQVRYISFKLLQSQSDSLLNNNFIIFISVLVLGFSGFEILLMQTASDVILVLCY